MIDLINIIQNECVPRRNCLLSVTDASGETGFIYFKDAQIIEVNQGTVWGQHAFQIIANWQLANYAISELPMGIKRTLWEPVDKMIEDIWGAGSADGIRSAFHNMPTAQASTVAEEQVRKIKRETQRLALNKLHTLQGFVALFFEIEGKLEIIKSDQSKFYPHAEWLENFTKQCQSFNKTLGTGHIREIFIKTDIFYGWRIPVEKGIIFLFSEPTVDLEIFELSMKEAVAPLI